MTIVIGGVAIILLLLLALAAFLRLDAAGLAKGLRTSGPIVLGIIGLVALLVGRAALGGMLISGALGWFGYNRRNAPARTGPRKKRRSSVRTAALEMELDHATGALEGLVLAGRHEQRVLGTMELDELRELYADLKSDPESLQLLETYLDGRFPAWREDADADRGDGERIAPGSSAMTKQEAYKVLGLEAGATAADIRKAHRHLMQRLHPDLGGTSFLAARINEAKDILLTNHN